MALFQRDHSPSTGPVQQRIIDVALNEAILSVMESLVPDYLAYGMKRQRVGGRMEGIAPAMPTRAPTAPASSSRATGMRSSSATCRPSADPTSPRIRGCRATRGAGSAARNSIRRSASGPSGHERDEALELLDEAGVPSGPIYTAADICADRQYEARNMIQHFDC